MKRALPIMVFFSFLIVWQLSIVIFKINPFVLPSPIRVLEVFRIEAKEIFKASFNSGMIAICGFALSLILGCLLAFFMSSSKWIEQSFHATLHICSILGIYNL